MSVRNLIKDIAKLKGIELKNSEVKDIHTKVAHAYLDSLLDNQIKPTTSKDNKESV